MPTQLIESPLPHSKEERFVSLTDMASKLYEAAEGRSLGEAFSLIKRGDAIMKRRDRRKES